METLQLKVLRKILRLNTTYIDRENNNYNTFEKSNQAVEEENTGRRKKKKVVPFVEAYKNSN